MRLPYDSPAIKRTLFPYRFVAGNFIIVTSGIFSKNSLVSGIGTHYKYPTTTPACTVRIVKNTILAPGSCWVVVAFKKENLFIFFKSNNYPTTTRCQKHIIYNKNCARGGSCGVVVMYFAMVYSYPVTTQQLPGAKNILFAIQTVPMG